MLWFAVLVAHRTVRCVVKELRRRQAFIKPSVDKRKKNQHAVYVQQMQEDED